MLIILKDNKLIKVQVPTLFGYSRYRVDIFKGMGCIFNIKGGEYRGIIK